MMLGKDTCTYPRRTLCFRWIDLKRPAVLRLYMLHLL